MTREEVKLDPVPEDVADAPVPGTPMVWAAIVVNTVQLVHRSLDLPLGEWMLNYGFRRLYHGRYGKPLQG